MNHHNPSRVEGKLCKQSTAMLAVDITMACVDKRECHVSSRLGCMETDVTSDPPAEASDAVDGHTTPWLLSEALLQQLKPLLNDVIGREAAIAKWPVLQHHVTLTS